MEDNIFTSLRDAIRARIGMPIIFTYFFSWILINSDYVVTLLFGSKELTDEVIRNHIHDPWADFGYPLILALAFTLIMPYIQHWLTLGGSHSDKLRKDKKSQLRIDDIVRRTDELKAEVQQDKDYLRKVRDNELDGWLRQKSGLESDVKEAKTAHVRTQKEFDEYKNEYNESQSVLAQTLADTADQLKLVNKDLDEANNLNHQYKRLINGKLVLSPYSIAKQYSYMIKEGIEPTPETITEYFQKLYDVGISELIPKENIHSNVSYWTAKNSESVVIKNKFVDFVTSAEPDLRDRIVQRIVGGDEILRIATDAEDKSNGAPKVIHPASYG